jgi:hypothetical protein
VRSVFLSWTIIGAVVLPVLSCSHVERFMERHVLGRGEGGKVVAAASVEPKHSLEEAKKRLVEKDFPNALNDYDAVNVKYPGDALVEGEYLGAFEFVHREAIRARKQEDCVTAGRDVYLLLDRLENLGDLAKRLSFPEKELQALLVECRGSLERKGLEKYRGGDLEGAIALWKSLLAFDPGNEEILNAIETASVQLEGMEQGSGGSEENTPPER